MTTLTALPSFLLSLLPRARARLFEAGVLKDSKLRQPVISVGNLTVGGTGKTPLVVHIGKLLLNAGHTPAILSHGYKGTKSSSTCLVSDGNRTLCSASECGDEPFLLSELVPGALVAVGRNRFTVGNLVLTHFSQPLFILDDGYQHLSLARDINLLLLDATNPFGGGQIFPFGSLREPLSAAQRADAFLLTRCHLGVDLDRIEKGIRRYNTSVPCFRFAHRATRLYDLRTKQAHSPRELAGKNVIAMAAIGNPGQFLLDIERLQMKVVKRFLFRDHHQFTQGEIESVSNLRKETSATAIITTEKDGVRFRHLQFGEAEFLALGIEAVDHSEGRFNRWLFDRLAEIEA